ncbi:unnamed protein product [Amoebophrya sp. A25]|nr:unnamed protein product [Amoebophrya sp. A25]|eukprot:GSA25T00012778001.1
MSTTSSLPVLTPHDVFRACEGSQGKKWIIVDNTVLDVGPLIDDKDGAHKGGNVFAIGRDNTHLFHELHANLPMGLQSVHRPDLGTDSVRKHIMEKVRKHTVGVIASPTGAKSVEVPLTSPDHRFWAASERRPPYLEKVTTAINDPARAAQILQEQIAVQGLSQVQQRAFWAVVGLLTADAAAQPTHWNYKISYYHQYLKGIHRFDNPEFLCPTQNQYYEVPCGSNSCFGDQAWVVLETLVRTCDSEGQGGSQQSSFIDSLVAAHLRAFGPDTSNYGPLGNTNVQSAGDLPIRGPWRHGSLDRFLRNVLIARKKFPECGSNDGSSDCFIRAVPVVARYAGDPSMLDRVSEVVRVTQNNALTVACACAAARILEQIILHGCSGNEAVKRCAEAILTGSGSATGSSASNALLVQEPGKLDMLKGVLASSSSSKTRASSSSSTPCSQRRPTTKLDREIASQLQELDEELSQEPYLDGVKLYSGGAYNAVTVS